MNAVNSGIPPLADRCRGLRCWGFCPHLVDLGGHRTPHAEVRHRSRRPDSGPVLHGAERLLCRGVVSGGSHERSPGWRGLLALGYLAGALTAVGFVGAFLLSWRHPAYLLGLFCLAGIYIAVEDALEGAMTADLAPAVESRGIAYGVMGTVNGSGIWRPA